MFAKYDKQIIIIFTGSIASVRAEKILPLFCATFKRIYAIFSKSAEEFIKREQIQEKFGSQVNFIWESDNKLITIAEYKEMAEKSDFLLISPISANSLTKLICGFCEDSLVFLMKDIR